jgi:hypothetical protein
MTPDFPPKAVLLELIVAAAGPNHGLTIYVNTEQIEVCGSLPRELRRGLKRVRMWCEYWLRNATAWDDAPIIWHAGDPMEGPRYAIPTLGELLPLIVERQEVLARRSARRRGHLEKAK